MKTDGAPVHFLPLFLRLKWRLADNQLSNLKRHMWIHIVVGLLALTALVGGGTAMFNMIFGYLDGLAVFGPLLMDHLIKMVLLAFFSMLIFSNLIIMLTTTYLSREIEYLMSHPIAYRSLYFCKLAESTLYSSWAFLVLSFPMFMALGHTRHLGWSYYVGAAALLAPYLIIPATLGALMALVISVWFPPRQLIRFALVMIGMGAVGALLAHHFWGLQSLFRLKQTNELTGMMQVLGFGDLLMLPSGWFGRGLVALEQRQWREAGFWCLALWSNAAMGVMILDWLAGPLYWRGWCNVRSSGTSRRRRAWGFYGFFDTLLAWLPRSTRALVAKDMTVFWRDPAQWSQLLILFGLLFIYIANLRSAAGMARIEAIVPAWRVLLSLFNIAATTFVLSILTTRFVYPMLSLEGKQQWIIGLAPVGRTRLVWVKFIVSWLTATGLTVPLALLSSAMLETDWPVTAMAIIMVLAMAIGLSALAVGLGALMPNFNDDNPARIASGLGGTINAILSLIYIGLSMGLVVPWVQLHIQGTWPAAGWLRWMLWATIPAWVLLQMAATIVPMALGLRRWRRMEF